jgi:hypothetical protein
VITSPFHLKSSGVPGFVRRGIRCLSECRPAAALTILGSGLLAGPALQQAARATAPDDALAPPDVTIRVTAPAGLSASYAATVRAGAPPKSRRRKSIQPPAPHPDSRVSVEAFTNLKWSPAATTFSSDGPVRLRIQPTSGPLRNEPILISGRGVRGDSGSGEIHIQHDARMESDDEILTGDEALYNYRTHIGYLTNAKAVSPQFRLQGERIELAANGSITVLNGRFTTCIHSRPDYHITAKRLVITPNKRVSARDVKLFAGNQEIFQLPTYRRSLNLTQAAPIPTPGYDSVNGISLTFTSEPIAEHHETLDYVLHVNARETPWGWIDYQHDLASSGTVPITRSRISDLFTDPKVGYLEELNPESFRLVYGGTFVEEPFPRVTFYATTDVRHFVFNVNRNDLQVTRLPEIGFRFANVLGRGPQPDQTPPAGLPQVVGCTEAPLQRIPNAPFLLNFNLTASDVQEIPTNVRSGRFALRSDLATQPIQLAPRTVLRFGAANMVSAYTRSHVYELFTPEAAIDYVPTRTSLIEFGYRYFTQAGSTPFLWDRLDERHDVHMRYQVGGPWTFELEPRMELTPLRVIDTTFAVVRNLDCMRLGLVYHTHQHSLELVFHLLPAMPSGAAEHGSPPASTGFAPDLIDRSPHF